MLWPICGLLPLRVWLEVERRCVILYNETVGSVEAVDPQSRLDSERLVASPNMTLPHSS